MDKAKIAMKEILIQYRSNASSEGIDEECLIEALLKLAEARLQYKDAPDNEQIKNVMKQAEAAVEHASEAVRKALLPAIEKTKAKYENELRDVMKRAIEDYQTFAIAVLTLYSERRFNCCAPEVISKLIIPEAIKINTSDQLFGELHETIKKGTELWAFRQPLK